MSVRAAARSASRRRGLDVPARADAARPPRSAPPSPRGASVVLAATLSAALAACDGAGRGEDAGARAPERSTADLSASAGASAAADALAAPPATLDDATSVVGATSPRVAPERLAEHPEARFASAGLIAPAAQRDGDAARGRQALVEEGYVGCGLPLRVQRELLAGSEALVLPDREAAAEGLPYFLNAFTDAEGVEVAAGNCLLCHATPLFGELVIGLGNEFLDFTTDPSAAVERAGALVRGEAETRAWERYADRVAAIAPHMTMTTVGTNPANNLTAALIAHRDAETSRWSAEPLLPLPPTEPPPVSVPPWWRMAKKHAMFNLGEGRDDHARMMMAASMLCVDSSAELDAIDRYAPDVRAYITSLEPPAWPFALDAALAARGREVFETNCSLCHGRYASDAEGRRARASDEYPNRLVPIEIVDTDPTLVELAHGEGVAYVDWFNRSWYGRRATAAPGPGYVAPPLDGIWATAPYLHNGSVPTLRALLDSETRPARWHPLAADASDPASYDTENLGWRHAADEAIGADVAPERVYDTARAAHGNGGHRFGDHLDDAARDALLEYLKTL